METFKEFIIVNVGDVYIMNDTRFMKYIIT